MCMCVCVRYNLCFNKKQKRLLKRTKADQKSSNTKLAYSTSLTERFVCVDLSNHLFALQERLPTDNEKPLCQAELWSTHLRLQVLQLLYLDMQDKGHFRVSKLCFLVHITPPLNECLSL